MRRLNGERRVRGISLCEVVLVLAFVSCEGGCYNSRLYIRITATCSNAVVDETGGERRRHHGDG